MLSTQQINGLGQVKPVYLAESCTSCTRHGSGKRRQTGQTARTGRSRTQLTRARGTMAIPCMPRSPVVGPTAAGEVNQS